MSKGKHAFMETEMARAIRAVRKAGLPVKSVRVNTQGEIQVDIGPPQAHDSSPVNEWDNVA